MLRFRFFLFSTRKQPGDLLSAIRNLPSHPIYPLIQLQSHLLMKGWDRINTFLPDELIIEIFKRLDSKANRDACSLVCKRWLGLERLSRTTLRIGASGTADLFIRLLSTRFVNVKNVYIDERLPIVLPFEFVRYKSVFVLRNYVVVVCVFSHIALLNRR